MNRPRKSRFERHLRTTQRRTAIRTITPLGPVDDHKDADPKEVLQDLQAAALGRTMHYSRYERLLRARLIRIVNPRAGLIEGTARGLAFSQGDVKARSCPECGGLGGILGRGENEAVCVKCRGLGFVLPD